MILSKLKDTIESFQILKANEKIVVGVSGGSDSVGLLHQLLELEDLQLKLVVAHVNHKLRAEESEKDAQFVRSLADNLSLKFEYKEVDTNSFKEKHKLSIEDAARRLRYEFFDDVLKKHSANKIATAHTLNDQVETVLMRLLRGSGSLGLSAMRTVSGNIIRPLLNIKKSEIKEYLESNNISWIEDSSNNSNIYLRNKIRNELIPLIENINPSASEVIARSAEVFAIESDFILNEVENHYSSIISDSSIGLIGNVNKYLELPHALRFGILRKGISEIKGDINSISSNHLFSIDKILESNEASGQIDLPGNCVFSKGYEVFCISKRDVFEKEHDFSLSESGNWRLSEDIEIEIDFTNDTSLWGEKNVGYFSMKKAEFPIKIRSYKDGDRFVPLGMGNFKKVKDFFIDEKVPLFLRNKIPVFTSENEIIWLGGMRIDDRFKADANDKEFLRIKMSGAIYEIWGRC